MLKLKSFISEENKNKNIQHLEDEMFNSGLDGIRDSITFLRGLRDMLSGHAKSSINLSVKWDGAPAIVCGTDPITKQFFLATKSAFNKTSPKINFSIHDIYHNHKEPLARILETAFLYLETLNITEVLQGDLLYTYNDLKRVSIDNVEYLTFKPNTITYAIPMNNSLSQKILNTRMGIVFHTKYEGPSIQTLKASYNIDVEKYKNSEYIWVTDAEYKDESGTSTLTADETSELNALISLAEREFKNLNTDVILNILNDEKLITLIKLYTNSRIKAGKPMGEISTYVHDLVMFIDDKFQKEIDELKTDNGKVNKKENLRKLKTLIDIHKAELYSLFEIQNLLIKSKALILKKLQSIKNIGTFLETENGFKVTSVEGFVAVDNMTGSIVKLVDRLEFSHANFNNQKNW